MTTLHKLAADVAGALSPLLPPEKRHSPAAHIAAFRPYLRAALGAASPHKPQDTRTRRWLVSLEFWHGGTLTAISEGRERGIDGQINAYGGAVVEGLDEAALLVAEFSADLSPDGRPLPGFTHAEMARALTNFRSSISRQGGRATMRRERGGWALVADVFRDDRFPAA